MTLNERCTSCNGRGTTPNGRGTQFKCPHCNGTGKEPNNTPSPTGETASAEHGDCNCAPVKGQHSVYCPFWIKKGTVLPCKHERTYSVVVDGKSDMRRCLDCEQTFSGRELVVEPVSTEGAADLSRGQKEMSPVELCLRRRIHQLEQHNQYFFRCESSWCNPGECPHGNQYSEHCLRCMELKSPPPSHQLPKRKKLNKEQI